jgi:IclR helix-turn-helix domain
MGHPGPRGGSQPPILKGQPGLLWGDIEMSPDLSRHDLEHMLAQGLSQREISRRTGIPRSTMQRLLKAPHIPEVLPEGRPKVAPSRPVPQSVAEAGPVLLEMAA